MGRITMELLRKRSEHNDGEIHSLEELALHQEKLEKIELIDKVCRNLKILLLQNNAIGKIENVGRLKNLEYLNLALNIIEKIENLEGCESLTKLDLTLNFVADLTSVKSLCGLSHLEQLYLVGNPCHDFSGYRDFVIAVLPQLKSLDGKEITKTEKIKACQTLDELEKLILKQQEEYLCNQESNKNYDENLDLCSKESTDSANSVKTGDGHGATADADDSEFWAKKSGNTPQVRREMVRQLEKQDEKRKPQDAKKVRQVRRLTNAEGKPFNINEAKISFSLHDECERSQLVLDLAIPKFMCTTLIDADVQPQYVKVVMKGKIFQLVLPEEIKPDSSFAQRSQTTGHLIITMPKVYNTSTMVWNGRESQQLVDLTKGKLPNKASSNRALTGKPKLASRSSPSDSGDLSSRLTSSTIPKSRKGILKKNAESDKSHTKIVSYDIPPLI